MKKKLHKRRPRKPRQPPKLGPVRRRLEGVAQVTGALIQGIRQQFDLLRMHLIKQDTVLSLLASAHFRELEEEERIALQEFVDEVEDSLAEATEEETEELTEPVEEEPDAGPGPDSPA